MFPNKSKIKAAIQRAAFAGTRGQLLNYATWLYDVPTVYPSKGPGRFIKVNPGDVYIVSYPRSGNTWLRFLVANMAHPSLDIDYGNIENVVPDIYVTSEVQLRKMSRPRILKSHESFDPRYKKVVYIVRDPLDVALSLFATLKRVNKDFDFSFSNFVTRHIEGEFDAWFGSWDQHVNSWIHQQSVGKDLHLIRYEELTRNPVEVLSDLAEFLGYSQEKNVIERAIARSSKDAMTVLYQSTSERLQRKIGENNSEFLVPNKKPTVEVEQEKELLRLKEFFAPTMRRLGYLSDE